MNFNSKTNPEAILKAIAECPEGPITLWHYKSTLDKAHRNNRERLNLTCERAGGNLFVFGGATWRLITTHNQGGNGAGFAILERVIDQPEPAPKPQASRKDYKAWWLEELKKRGWLPEQQSAPAHPPAHPKANPDFGYDYAPDWDV